MISLLIEMEDAAADHEMYNYDLYDKTLTRIKSGCYIINVCISI